MQLRRMDDVDDGGKDDRLLTAYAASRAVERRLAQASLYPAADHLAP